MVLLHFPFRNELLGIIDRDNFLHVYEEHEREILENRKEFEANINIDEIIREIEAICIANERVDDAVLTEQNNTPTSSMMQPNDDDLTEYTNAPSVSAIWPRTNVMIWA